ncbi:MAG: nitroreductase family deazaflavin-dependent oxidoreductase [Acidimicrobiales bacterium]|nr:nitroreductase family deazaflavin-dependent oxidoreductase [Acidimicrobiales bacterium]
MARLADLVARAAVSRPGRRIERWAVWHTGQSPFGRMHALAQRTHYRPSLVVLTTGRRTGRPHQVVLTFYRSPEPDDDTLAIVGSRGGADRDPDWVANLEAAPHARIRVRRRTVEVRARRADGDERARWWAHITERAPNYDRMQQRAPDRPFPVMLLEPVEKERQRS